MTTVEQANASVPPADPELVEVAPSRGLTTGTVGLVAVGLALLSALTTFLVLSSLTPIPPTPVVGYTLLLVDAATVLVLLAMLGYDVWQLIQARRRGRAGSRLHMQMVVLCSLIAAVPAILIAIVATVNFDRGLDRFFALRTRLIIENSLNVAQAYLREHAQSIGTDVMNTSFELNGLRGLFDTDRDRYRKFLGAQASLRRLSAIMLIDDTGKIIERADIPGASDFVLPKVTDVTDSDPLVLLGKDARYVAAAVKLPSYDKTYLFIARVLDPLVIAHLKETQLSIGEYAKFEANRLNMQIGFALMYAVIALTVLLSAVWIGFNFADRLVSPIRRLIAAANLVSTGNLFVQVPVGRRQGDMGQLGSTFNKMTQELRTQRDDIMRARDLIDSRRLFTEAVLAGASAGVIGVDSNGRISILNRSAEKLIDCGEADALGKPVAEIVPELAEIVSAANAGSTRLIQGQISINRGGKERIASVRVTSEQTGDPEHGYVITLDDISELVTAQRTSAWADIARRIAHEIKNPLTPIQLSAERLRRKYGSVITEDKAVFEQCTSTIVRQVEDIRRMVDEFSRFARMPKAVIAPEDVADTVRQVVFLMRVGNADIDFNVEIGEDPMPAFFDRRLISQGLTNIVKNATEAVAAVPPEELGRGHIKVSATRVGGFIHIDVVDNGIGLPRENRSRLLEPYVTTREKGTGLGLAIVGKILEDHGGGIELRDAAELTPGARGTWVRMTFASEDTAAEKTARETVS